MTSLSARRVGALVVLERREGLKTYIENGSRVDAAVSYELLVTLFAPGTPLHDGAVIISADRIAAAASFLPLSLREGLPKRFGTRHRAAIGITEETDALAVLVSEERGTISLSRGGELLEDLDAKSLRDLLLPRAGGGARMSVRTLVFRNFGTKLVALAIACATWWVVSGDRRERISERSYRIPLSIVNIPTGTMIVSPLPDAVDVASAGPFTALRQLEPTKLDAVVDLIEARPGREPLPARARGHQRPAQRRGHLDLAARGARRPRFGRREARADPARADRTPGAGLDVEEIAAEPRTARIAGPAGTLARDRRRPHRARLGRRTRGLVLRCDDAGRAVRRASACARRQIVTVRVRMRSPLPTPTPTPKPARRK